MSRRIYLAGPDVFLANAKAVGAEKVRLCAAAGYVGLFPLDAPLTLEGKTKHAQARLIQEACEVMMRSADLCLANCTPFRGSSMDSGTAYEVGFMRALGKPVIGYSAVPTAYADRVRQARAAGAFAHAPALSATDPSDSEIEDFDLAENLMIAIASQVSGSPIVARAQNGADHLAAFDAFRVALGALPR